MIHLTILRTIQARLQSTCIDSLAEDDPTRAGVIFLGPLQGDPDPDQARISITIHENDPEMMLGKEVSGSRESWDDVIEEVEVGGVTTWRRRFTVKARCLLEGTQEDLAASREIASTVRSRIEKTLLGISLAGVQTDDEYVAMGIRSEHIRGEMVQSGGPDAYDFHIRIRFEVLTTTKVGGVL